MENSEVKSNRSKQGLMAVFVALISNVVLAVIKTSIGVIGHSPALLADGINSTSDVAYSLIVSVFVRLASKPADDEHPYGHSQLETIGALLVGSFVVTTSIAIFWNSVDTIYDLIAGVGTFSGGSTLTLVVALGTVIVKIALFIYTRSVSEETNNPSVSALAFDHRNDIFSGMGALAGIYLGRQGVYWGDPLAGALVALVILYTGIQILRESTSDLMDTVPGKVLKAQVLEALGAVQGILEVEDLHAHRFGPYLVINVTICVPGEISVFEGDRIATLTEEKIHQSIDFVRTVHVHYHPRWDEKSVE